MDLVLFGIQGSGKGTLGKLISDRYGFKIFETGGELRKLAAENSELGHKIKAILEAGNLVTREIVDEIVENFLNSTPPDGKILFDGIPRFLEQAESFDALMRKSHRNFLGILIDVPEKEVIRRLSTRRVCKNCKTVYPAVYGKNVCEKCEGELITRSDDNPESIKTRIENYYKETVPVIEHYKKLGLLITMNGNQNIEDCKNEIFKLIEEKSLN